ncbi:chromosome 2 open reading frame 73 [Elysia marginata]|uniref:Chromosome 2 open reading frame 73 n=1 Tax=Elysia marginata TaxID=1093978 RepID=A0AAV4G7H4_9GAST|nr:chromosome 2 open reading frame 73 [Elysia marginata]
MPPIQRKKRVDEKYNPDTFRVMSEDAVSDHPKYKPLPYRASFEPRTPTPKTAAGDKTALPDTLPIDSLRPLKSTRVLPQSLLDYRAHRPQAKACGFLDRNVRFLNEPICNVYTKPLQHEEAKWWPSRANPGSLVVPPYAEDTHYRVDFNLRHGERPSGSGRHTAHLNREAALGSIPVNYLRERDGSQRFYKEGLSYEHMYNSRADPNYPIRGKRHGAFVWSRMNPLSQQKFIDYHLRLDEEERQAQKTGQDGPIAMQQKTGSAPVIRSANHKQSVGINCSASRHPLSPLKTKQSSAKSPSPPIKSADVASCNGSTQKVSEQVQAPEAAGPEVSVPSVAPQCSPPMIESKETAVQENLKPATP